MLNLNFVVDAACVGLEDPIKGHVPVGFAVVDKSKCLLVNEAQIKYASLSLTAAR